jgi:hypothetical protein
LKQPTLATTTKKTSTNEVFILSILRKQKPNERTSYEKERKNHGNRGSVEDLGFSTRINDDETEITSL